MKKYRYFVYDLDGTLVNTAPSIIATLQMVEDELGFEKLPVETLYKFIGPALHDTYRQFYGVTEEQMKHTLDTYRRIYREKTTHLSTIFEGIEEILDYTEQRGCVSAVATLKHLDTAVTVLQQCGIQDKMLYVAGTEDGRNADKAMLIEDCIAAMGNPPKREVVFFGDSPYDGIGAQKAGVDFVALTYGFGFMEKGSLDGIDHVFCAQTPQQLVDFVKNSTAE